MSLSNESKPREAALAKEMRLTIKVSSNARRVILVALLSATAATAQEFGSVDEGRRFAHEACAQCHGVEKKEYSTNPQAPAFGDIANIPGMTSTALTVALQTSHREMPNFVIKGRDAQNIIAYILSLRD